MKLKKLLSIGLPAMMLHLVSSAQTSLLKFEPVSFSKVNITDNFWSPKLRLVATATLKACIYQTETATPRIKNFQKVARNKGEQHEGIFYDDSDVFKALEAMAYSLKNRPDSILMKRPMNGSIKLQQLSCPMDISILITR